MLVRGGYRGYYSFEWEKAWHPEIQEPEVAFPHYAKLMRRVPDRGRRHAEIGEQQQQTNDNNSNNNVKRSTGHAQAHEDLPP